MRTRLRVRPPTPAPAPVFRAVESTQPELSRHEVASAIAQSLNASGLLSTSVDDARSRFQALLSDRDQDGRLELRLDAPELAGVFDPGALEGRPLGSQLTIQNTVDLDALAIAEPFEVSNSETQDTLSRFLPLVLDKHTGALRAFDGQLAEHESLIEKVHFAVSDQTITLRVVEHSSGPESALPPTVLFRFPDGYRSYKETGVFSSPEKRLSWSDTAQVVELLDSGADISGCPRLTAAIELLRTASGPSSNARSTALIKDELSEIFAATPSKAWIGRQAIDLIESPSSARLLEEITKRSTSVPPELVFSTMFAEGFNIHWATRATWKGLSDDGPVYGMHHLGLDLLGRTEALAAAHETETNRDMNLEPPPPPKGPPRLGYPTAPTFDNLVKLGLLPEAFDLVVSGAKNLPEGQGDRIVYDVELWSVGDAIQAVHATLAFCQERFVRDFDHAYGVGAHAALSPEQLCFAVSAYYNGGWMLGRKVALRDLGPERRGQFGLQELDRTNNLSIRTNAMVRVALHDLLRRAGVFSP